MRILARADLSQNLAFYCAQYDPSIIERTRSAVGDAQELMLHIQGEVIAGLPRDEAFEIVVQSANTARSSALLAIRKNYGPDAKKERTRIAAWCEDFVVPFLKEVVAWHDQSHKSLDQTIQEAKQGLHEP